MKSPNHSRWAFGLSLNLVLATLLSHESLRAGPPGTTTPVAPPQSGAVRSTGPTASPTSVVQTPAQTHDFTKPSGTAQSQSAAVPAAPAGKMDYGVFRLGGKVYSSGTEDVIVRVLDQTSVHPVPPGHNWPKPSPFNGGVYLLSPGPARFIASNKQAGTPINLGTLPPGELIFGIQVPDCGCYLQTGDVSRNPDRLDHVSMRTFKSGYLELWFEDAPGPKGTDRSDRDFDDLVMSVTGGIDNGAMANLVQNIQQQKGESREASIAALKKISPKAAAFIPAQGNVSAK